MLGGSAWAGCGDRAIASVEYPQQRPLADWERKRARRRAEFAARIPVTAAQVASEISAAIASELKAAVAAALDAAFARHDEAIRDAVTNTKDRPGASVSSPSSAQTASVTSERAMSIQMVAAAESISVAVGAASICNDSQLALATPITCSAECLARENGATGAMTAPSVSPTSATPSVSVVHEEDIHIAVPCLQPLLPSMAMSAVLDKPEGADTAMTLEDEQPLACASVERQLTLVVASDVVDDHSFVVGTSLVRRTLAALGVAEDDHIVNKHEATLLLKLLEFQPLQSKAQNVLQLLPQVAQAMVPWGTSMNQCTAKISDMCSGFGYPTTNSLSISLFQWDPGEQTRITQNLVTSRVFILSVGVEELTENSYGDWDNYKQPGYNLVTNKDELFLPLKLLIQLSKSREPGMCSGLGCAPTYSVCLLPWDPGEKPMVLRDSIISRDIAWDACVELIDAHVSHSCDHHQKKSGYVKTQSNSHWPTQVFWSSESVIGMFCGQVISVQLLQYQFDCASTFGKLYVERIIACAPGYPAICAEQVLFEHFLLEFFYSRSNFHRLYLEAWAYWSLASSSVPYHCAPIIVGLVFPYGSVSVPWKNSWSSLFDIWRANWSCKLRQYILKSQSVALLMACGNTTLKVVMEQWDPGIARFLHISNEKSEVLWPVFHSVTPSILLQPWDPGLPLSGMDNKLQPRPSWGLSALILSLASRAMYASGNWSYLNCTLGSPDLAIPHWVLVNFDSASVHFQWAIAGQKWNSHHIRQGNILFCYYVEIPRTVILASWKLWLQYCSAGHEYLYGYENFRWIIVWSLGYQFSLSGLQALLLCTSSVCGRTEQVTSQRKLLDQGVKMIFVQSFQSPLCWTMVQSTGDTLKLTPFRILFPCLPAAKPPDSNGTCAVLMYLHIVLGLMLLVVLVVWTHLTLVKATQLHYRGFNSCKYPMPSVYQVMLKSCTERMVLKNDGFEFAQMQPNSSDLIYFEEILDHSHILMANIFDNVDLPSRVQDVQLPLKLVGSSEHSDTFAEAIGRRNVAARTYYRGHCLDNDYYFDIVRADKDYYIDVFYDQVHIGHDYFLACVVCYLNLVKVCLDYDTHRNLGEVIEHQVPWDPGGSAWHRLEVKPKFKEGGMLATFPIVTMGWTVGFLSWAWAYQKPPKAATTYTRGFAMVDSAWNGLA